MSGRVVAGHEMFELSFDVAPLSPIASEL